MKLALVVALLLCAVSSAPASPAHPAAKSNPADLTRFSPAQQYQYAHLLLQADDRARYEAGCDPVLEDGSAENFPLYRRLRLRYQGAVERQYHITRAQGMALLREAYVKDWNNS